MDFVQASSSSPHLEINAFSSEVSPAIVTQLEETEVKRENAKFIFPKPSGQFPIGIQSYVLQDTDRSIGVSIHYPSQQGSSFRCHPLEPYFKELGNIDSNIETAKYTNCCSYAQPDVPPIKESFPVVLMAHGMGMNSDDYQPIVEELASQGFCVVTIESPGVAGYSRVLESQGKAGILTEEEMLDDKQAMQLQIKDVEFVLRTLQDFKKINPNLAASMDLQKIGVMGHSLGGGAAAQICRNNAKVMAGMNLDGKLLGENAMGSIFQPFVTIQSDRPSTVIENLLPDVKASLDLSKQAEQLKNEGNIEEANAKELEAITLLEAGVKGAENFLDPMIEFDEFHKNVGLGSYQVVLNGSRHAGFSALHSLAHVVGLTHKKNYQNWEKQIPTDLLTWAATNRHIVSFFSKNLKAIPSQITSGSKIKESI